MRTTFVLAIALLVACKDQGPPGPNLIVCNEGLGAAQLTFVSANAQDDTVTRAVDTLYAVTVPVGGKVCTTLDLSRLPTSSSDPGALVLGVAVVAPDTLVSSPFWLAAGNNWSEVLIVRDGPELVQTNMQRVC